MTVLPVVVLDACVLYPAAQRDLFAEVRDRYLRNHAALNELLRHRQASGIFSALQQKAVSLVAPSEQHQYAEDRWTLQPPLPAAQRGTAPTASLVCKVERTIWPVSAALIAISAVSASRISPTKIMFGS